MKTLLFSFNVGHIDPEIMQNRLNDAPEIKDWLLLTNGLVIIKTDHAHSEISAKIHVSFPGMKFLVTEITPPSCEGWMPQAFWDFLNQPHRQAIPA